MKSVSKVELCKKKSIFSASINWEGVLTIMWYSWLISVLTRSVWKGQHKHVPLLYIDL